MAATQRLIALAVRMRTGSCQMQGMRSMTLLSEGYIIMTFYLVTRGFS